MSRASVIFGFGSRGVCRSEDRLLKSGPELQSVARSSHAKGLRRRACADLSQVVREFQLDSSRTDSPVRILYAQPASSVSARCGSADDLEDQIFTLIEPGPPESARLTGGHVASV